MTRRYHPRTEEHRPCHRLGVSLALPRYLCGMSEPRANLKRVQALLKGDMDAFKPKFRQSVSTDVVLLDTVMRYILRRKGKQMRPMFVFLSARLHGGVGSDGHATDRAHTAATLIELLHTATLVHDDVVDESPLRRGVFSIQALWKKKVAVLVGDYLLSRGLLAAVDAEAYDLLKITSRAVREMSEGELLQIEKARRLDITEEVYFDIIRRKTASLLAACCACGAASAGADDETVQRMWGLGERVGLAFQIQDDLLDLGEGDRTGKPTGQDIRERKMTLPLIHTLAKASPSERRRLIRLVKHKSDDPTAVKEVMDTILAGPGMERARSEMRRLKEESLALLDELGSQDAVGAEAREALRDLIGYTIQRVQ